MSRPYFAWPGWDFLRYASLLSTINAAWFAFVYGGCEWITAHRTLRVRIHLPLELSIPLMPGAVVLYMSIYLMFLAGPFVLRERREFTAATVSLVIAIFIGGIGFLLIPSTAAFAPPPSDLGIWTGLFNLADRWNLDYNMVPSLHVALSVCCASALARSAPPLGRCFLWSWAAAIAASTVLTHQHHLLDVATGWADGLIATRLARSWIVQTVEERQTEPIVAE
jgi:membrane-associated phospholipid phosphatase